MTGGSGCRMLATSSTLTGCRTASPTIGAMPIPRRRRLAMRPSLWLSTHRSAMPNCGAFRKWSMGISGWFPSLTNLTTLRCGSMYRAMSIILTCPLISPGCLLSSGKMRRANFCASQRLAPVRLLPVAQSLSGHFCLLPKTKRQICLLSARAELSSHRLPCPYPGVSPVRRHGAFLLWLHTPCALCGVCLPLLLLSMHIQHWGLWYKICFGTASSGHIRALSTAVSIASSSIVGRMKTTRVLTSQRQMYQWSSHRCCCESVHDTGGVIMRSQPFLRSQMLVYVVLVLVACWGAGMPRAGAAGAWPEAGTGNIPVTVDKLVIAFDGWGGDVLDPWQYLGTGLLQSYLNLRLMHRDENMQVVPLWATAWQQTPEGITLTLDPQARWQDGTPATAEDLKANIEALMGQYAPAFKGTPRLAYMKKADEEVQVIDPTHVFIK